MTDAAAWETGSAGDIGPTSIRAIGHPGDDRLMAGPHRRGEQTHSKGD
jgi:hypothetical protein